MGKFRFGIRLLAALALLAGLANASLADEITVAQLLGYKPTQKVEVSNPTTDEAARCTKELENGKPLPNAKVPTAWVVKDPQGKILRKFHDTTGAGGVNIIAYYRDGEEVYRDMVVGGKISQFRWVGSEGSKWGVDLAGAGKIDTWTVISPEEVSQEVLAAVLTKDQKRFEALLLTKAELDAMGLPAAEVQRIQAKLAAVPGTFAKTCKDLAALKPTTQWIHLETKLQQTTPADAIDAKLDFVRYRHGAILYQDGNGAGAKHDWVQTGEIIQVGKAWRLIQGPTSGMEVPPEPGTTTGGPGIKIPEAAASAIKKLKDLDDVGPGPGKDGNIAFNLKRATILKEIAAFYTKAEDRSHRDMWMRQLADCYATAAQNGDKSAIGLLKDAMALEAGSAILPYFQYRYMTADYAIKLSMVGPPQEELNKLQESWKETLTKFVTDHPKTDDTPDAIMQLGMVNEYFGTKTEGEAKAAYGLLIKSFPTHTLAKRAQGCLDRLSLEGKELDLTSPTLAGGEAFDVRTLKGKAVLVYYWASWNDLAVSDFNKIKLALKDYAGKAELVSVNLDQNAVAATAFLRTNPVEGTHLHQPGGLDSPLAVRYGIASLPVMFLVGPDGKVITRTAQASTVDEELKKLFKTEEKKDK